MDRAAMLARLDDPSILWDVLVVGGGATGLGIALDSAARGYKTALVERDDFGQGTSSRSTKLVHGGVRYLQNGQVGLVVDSLRERGLMLQLAPHLVRPLRFILPAYAWWERPYYGLGLTAYDVLAGRYRLGPSRGLSVDETLKAVPTLRHEGLYGGVQYFDAQFDDARFLVNLAQTAAEQGATTVNHVRVERLVKEDGNRVSGVEVHEVESGRSWTIRSRVVINATGPFSDALRHDDDPRAAPLIAPSQGAHVVLPKSFLPGESAILVPRTPDGRVMFAIPWHDHVVVGTTDTPVSSIPPREPVALPDEIDRILETASAYLARPPTRSDVLSTFAGIRPLAGAGAAGRRNTAAISRDHHIEISPSGLVTICGGKWTTYRRMAEDAVDQAAKVGGLAARPCATRTLPIHGHQPPEASERGDLTVYGSDAREIVALEREEPSLARRLHPDLPYTEAQVVWAARHEMARTVDDVLSRRLRASFLNISAARGAASRTAELLSSELDRDAEWVTRQIAAFDDTAKGYRTV